MAPLPDIHAPLGYVAWTWGHGTNKQNVAKVMGCPFQGFQPASGLRLGTFSPSLPWVSCTTEQPERKGLRLPSAT